MTPLLPIFIDAHAHQIIARNRCAAAPQVGQTVPVYLVSCDAPSSLCVEEITGRGRYGAFCGGISMRVPVLSEVLVCSVYLRDWTGSWPG